MSEIHFGKCIMKLKYYGVFMEVLFIMMSLDYTRYGNTIMLWYYYIFSYFTVYIHGREEKSEMFL